MMQQNIDVSWGQPEMAGNGRKLGFRVSGRRRFALLPRTEPWCDVILNGGASRPPAKFIATKAFDLFL